MWWRLARGWTAANTAGRGAAIARQCRPAAGPGRLDRHRASAPRLGPQGRHPRPALIGSQTAAASPPRRLQRDRVGRTPGRGGATGRSTHRQLPGQPTPDRPRSNGLGLVIIAGQFGGAQPGRLTIVLTGQPASGGGVQLTGSQVNVGTTADPTQYQGHVTQLDGSTVVAALADAHGNAHTATIQLQLTGIAPVNGTIQVGA